jgi:hypothetical protein
VGGGGDENETQEIRRRGARFFIFHTLLCQLELILLSTGLADNQLTKALIGELSTCLPSMYRTCH